MEIKEVYIGSRKTRPTTPVYPLESIITRQKADSAWQMYIPYWDPNWKVSIDDVVVQNWWSSYAFWWYTADTEHIVKIEPTTLNYWRAKNYKWSQRTWPIRNTVIEIIQDKSYVWFADSATNTWNNFRENEYRWCTNLINTAEEYIPDTVTTIWNYFRYYQHSGCRLITKAPKEVLPNTVTSIWSYFRAYEYLSCNALTESAEEVLPNTITSIWNYFRNEQYSSCSALKNIVWWVDQSVWWPNYRYQQFSSTANWKTIKVLSDVWYNSSSSTWLTNANVSEIQVPTLYLSNFTSTNNYPRRNFNDDKFVWY